MKEKMLGIIKEKKLIQFAVVWVIFSFILFIKYYDGEVGLINTTMFAFTYKYGFVSRGFIGTIFQFVNYILPFDIMSYKYVFLFVQCSTVLFFLILAVFFGTCLVKCKKNILEELKNVILFFSIFAIPMFISYENFGRLDVYCVMLSIIAAILLVLEKAEWIVVVLSAIGVMIHQGNVFMFLNIILILLIYKAMTYEGERRKKYLILLGLSFGVASSLFLYFELFSHFNGENIEEEIKAVAASLHYAGYFHSDVIDHEILGIDLSSRELQFRVINFVEFPIYLILVYPYIYYGFKFFKNIIKSANNKVQKWKYILVSIGAGTILPDLLLKCDYGRWMFALVCYYCVVMISLIGMGDPIIQTELKEITYSIKQKWPVSVVLLGYPILLQPFLDVEICSISYAIAEKLNNIFLHLW